MFVLDVFVLDAAIGNILYQGEKAFKNVQKISGARNYTSTEFGAENHGFIHFDRIAVNNLIKEEAKVEILVHSDLEKNNTWVKILSKSGLKKDDQINFDGRFIPCNQALIKVVTSHGQHTKLIKCLQNGIFASKEEQKATEVYKSATFMPNLFEAVSKIVVAPDNKGLMESVLEPIKQNSIGDIDAYLTSYGSFQRSLTHEMGNQIFEEKMIMALEKSNQGLNINNIQVFYSIKSNLQGEQALNIMVPKAGGMNMWKMGLFFAVFSALLVYVWVKMTKKSKTKAFEVDSRLGNMKVSFVNEA